MGSAAHRTAVVIGGINLDVLVEPRGPLVAATSNPGRVTIGAGGVARNIAELLARLGVPTRLIGAVGDAAIDRWSLAETEDAGVDISGVQRVAGGRVGSYVSILDGGNLATAVADLTTTEQLRWDEIRDALESGPADLVVVDCNLLPEVLAAVVRWANAKSIPVVVEPVSVAKSTRIGAAIGRIDVITPNEGEADAIGGILHPDLRIGHALITRGDRGARYCRGSLGEEQFALPTVPEDPVNVNGAGDAFVAGVCAAILDQPGGVHGEAGGLPEGSDAIPEKTAAIDDLDWRRVVITGLAAGTLAIRSRETTPRTLTREGLAEMAGHLAYEIGRQPGQTDRLNGTE